MFHAAYQPHFVYQIPPQHHPNHTSFNDNRQLPRHPLDVYPPMMGYEIPPLRQKQFWSPPPKVNHRWRDVDGFLPLPASVPNSRHNNKVMKPGSNHWNYANGPNHSNANRNGNYSNKFNHHSNHPSNSSSTRNYKSSNHSIRWNESHSNSNHNRGDDSSDSGVSSRSPTPNNCTYSGHNEGDRLDNTSEDSVSCDSSKDIKGSKEVSGPLPSTTINSEPNSNCNSYQFRKNYSMNRSSSTSNIPHMNYQQGQPKKRYLVQYQPAFQHNNRPPPLHNHRIPTLRKLANIGFNTPPPLVSKSPISFYSPDRFLARSHLVEITKPPKQLRAGNQWDNLSETIWEKFRFNQQSEELYVRKVSFWKYLYQFIKRQFPHYGLCLVGSTMTGFATNKSDIDMCLVVHNSEIDQRNEAVYHLGNLLEYLDQLHFAEKLDLIHAKVPILKFRVSRQNIDVDLNCNNAVGIRNTHLLYCYAQADWRVRPLVMIIKLWAHYHNINDAKNMTISSYSLSLMVIHFLQCGITPQVLPCLHRMYAGKFSPHTDISQVDMHEDLPSYKSENTMTLGELLLRFFQYYDNFDYGQFALSVRLGSKIPIDECRKARSSKNEPHSWKYLCIEEPFDLTNTARSVFDPDVFDRIRSILNTSYKKLKKTHSLDAIFRCNLYK